MTMINMTMIGESLPLFLFYDFNNFLFYLSIFIDWMQPLNQVDRRMNLYYKNSIFSLLIFLL